MVTIFLFFTDAKLKYIFKVLERPGLQPGPISDFLINNFKEFRNHGEHRAPSGSKIGKLKPAEVILTIR